MRTFTKIRKWANDNNYKVEDTNGYGGKPCIYVYVENIRFEVEMRDSTIYQSVRGQKGNPKGIYMRTEKREENGIYRGGYSLYYYTQGEVIEKMESEIAWHLEGRYV